MGVCVTRYSPHGLLSPVTHTSDRTMDQWAPGRSHSMLGERTGPLYILQGLRSRPSAQGFGDMFVYVTSWETKLHQYNHLATLSSAGLQ